MEDTGPVATGRQDMAKGLKFRVWIDQINQTNLVVTAKDANEATEKAERKWRRDVAIAHGFYVEEITSTKNDL